MGQAGAAARAYGDDAAAAADLGEHAQHLGLARTARGVGIAGGGSAALESLPRVE